MESEEPSVEREVWNTRVGFILAAVGSAVGLGNIWRFPYLTAESGGASFVLLYIILLFLIGIPVMIAEFVIGRSSRKSPIQALSADREHDWTAVGLLFVFTGFWILSYYSVVAGWTIQYMLDSLSGHLLATDPGTYFASIKDGTPALMYHLLFMAITTGIVVGGVKDGIERSVKVLIPLLVVLMAGLAIWAAFREGATAGYEFYLSPDYTKLFNQYSLLGLSVPFVNLSLLANAAGQTFFTLSLGMGAMITYSSYLSSRDDLVEETLIISFSNFSISLLAGLIVFPIITSFGLMGEVGESTISTLFIAIPKAFSGIGGIWDSLLSFVFFGCLFLAALTSGISLLEVVTSSLIDQYDFARSKAAAASGFIIFLVGALPAWRTSLLSMMDKIASNVLLLGGGFLLVIYVVWAMKTAREELARGLSIDVSGLWYNLLRYVVTPVLLVLLIRGVYAFF